MTNIEILNKITKKALIMVELFLTIMGYNKREFLQIPRQKSEAVIGGVPVK